MEEAEQGQGSGSAANSDCNCSVCSVGTILTPPLPSHASEAGKERELDADPPTTTMPLIEVTDSERECKLPSSSLHVDLNRKAEKENQAGGDAQPQPREPGNFTVVLSPGHPLLMSEAQWSRRFSRVETTLNSCQAPPQVWFPVLCCGSNLKTIFSRFGIPETVISDNSPQYASHEFTEFAEAYEFSHITSSPLFAQSNGQAERTVQTVKKLLKGSKDPHMALLAYRSTPFPWCNLSLSELLMGRRLRGNIPLLNSQLTPEWKYLDGFRSNNCAFNDRQKHDYDRHHGARTLPPIPDDVEVWITSGDQPATGTIVFPASTPRSSKNLLDK